MKVVRNKNMVFDVSELSDLIFIENNKRKPISRGNRIEGIFPYCGATKIQDYINTYSYDGVFLLVGEDGADWSAKAETSYIMSGRFNVNNHAHVLKEKEISIKFLKYYLNYFDLNKYITGAVIRKLTKQNLSKIKIFYKKNDTFKIANLLDKQQSLIDSYKEKLSILEQQEQYYQDKLLSGEIRIKLNQEAQNYAFGQGWIDNNGEVVSGYEDEFEEWLKDGFGGKIEFYKNSSFKTILLNNKISLSIPSDWFCLKLKNILKGKVGLTPSKSNRNNYVGNVKWINISDIKGDNKIISYKKTININAKNVKSKLLEKNSLLYSFKLTVGNIGFTKYNNMVTNEAIIGFQPSQNKNLKYFYFILKKYLKLNATKNIYGSSIMNQKLIYDSDLIVSNCILERIIISSYLNFFYSQKQNLTQKIQLEEQKMDYLMDKLLSGELQVVD